MYVRSALEDLDQRNPTADLHAGHSAGGAWAYILGYGSPGIAAVFSMSAPFYSVSSVADPGYVPPIHMYYGDGDPNYTGGSATALEAQWTRLGAVHETDVQAGFGHSTWPPSSLLAGLTFLLMHRTPGTPPASTCGGTDAGMASSDAGRGDAGSSDAPVGADGATGSDAGTAGSDAGTRPRPSVGSCACRAQVSAARAPLAMLAMLVALLCRRRGARPPFVRKQRGGGRSGLEPRQGSPMGATTVQSAPAQSRVSARAMFIGR